MSPPDPDAIARMAAAVRRHRGARALDFACDQHRAAEGDMIAVWSAIVAHLEASS